MMDDVFIYHAHTFFVFFCECVGYLDLVSTSASRELAIRDLESEPHTFYHDSLLHQVSYHFGIVKNAQGHAFKGDILLELGYCGSYFWCFVHHLHACSRYCFHP